MEQVPVSKKKKNGHDSHFRPAGAKKADNRFASVCPRFAHCPPRLAKLPNSVVSDVNDWHMPMLNDLQRNEAYMEALQAAVKPDDIVLEVGCGSGILSLLAARAGAKHVYAIEASKDFGGIAALNFKRNNLSSKITLINAMSTDVEVRTVKKRKLNSGGQKESYICRAPECPYWYDRSPQEQKENVTKIIGDTKIISRDLIHRLMVEVDRCAEDVDDLLRWWLFPHIRPSPPMWYTQISEQLRENIKAIISNCKHVNKEVEDHLMAEVGIQREDVQDLLSWWFHINDEEGAKNQTNEIEQPIYDPQDEILKFNEKNEGEETQQNVIKHLPQRPTLLVAEILGTMMDGESNIHYYADCRKRLLAPNARIIPCHGVQYCALISSEQFKKITSASDFAGLDLNSFNRFRDCVSLVFSKNYGVLMNNMNFEELIDPIIVYEVDFTRDGLEVINGEPKTYTVDVKKDGEAVALMYWWEVYLNEERTIKISTHPNETKSNIPRDLNWGQGLQLVEDPAGWDNAHPSPCMLKAGQKVTIQFNCEERNGALFHGRIMSDSQLDEEDKKFYENNDMSEENSSNEYYRGRNDEHQTYDNNNNYSNGDNQQNYHNNNAPQDDSEKDVEFTTANTAI